MDTLKRYDYYTQNNNRFRPAELCNWTSIIMGACQSGIKEEELLRRVAYWNKIKGWKYFQPEDSGGAFTQQDKYRDIARGSFPESDKYPEQSWNALVAAFNDWIGEDLAFILWDQTEEEILDKLKAGFGVVVCGDFPTTKGHFVNVGWINAGIVTINDPHGNPLDNYTTEDGYNIHIPIGMFRNIIHGPGTGRYRAIYVRPRQ